MHNPHTDFVPSGHDATHDDYGVETPALPPTQAVAFGVLLVGCVLVGLAGVVLPIVRTEIEKSKMLEAQAGTQEIADGLVFYARDTLYLPTGARGRTNLSWMFGPGRIPANNHFAQGGEGRPLADCLSNDSMGGPAWAGPYVNGLKPDPWGHAYLANVDGWLRLKEHAFVLSAGPNGQIETTPNSNRASGDDILFLLD